MSNDIKYLVDEYVKWDKLGKEAKDETEKIKARIQEMAVPTLENSKSKTVKYYGTGNNVAVVTNSETVKLASYTLLKITLGDIIGDYIKQDVSYKMSEPFKRIVAALCTGSYVDQTLNTVITQMAVDDATAKLLRKKLKGNPEKDRKVLESVGIEDVEYWVYFIAEAMAYEKIVRLLEVAGHREGTPEFEKAMAEIKQAVIVEEGLKIGVEYESETAQFNGKE